MTTPSFRDVEQLSASLDGQLSQAEKTRLEARIQLDPALAATLADLRQARAILRRTPKRRLPRNFTLTSKMAGIRPPVPRLVPAFSWASAVAMLLFVCTLGTNLLGRLSFGAAAPLMAAAPSGMGGGVGGGPVATQPPTAMESLPLGTPTPEMLTLLTPEATQVPDARTIQPQVTSKTPSRPMNLWLWIWPGLAILLLTSALLIRWSSIRAFHRKSNPK